MQGIAELGPNPVSAVGNLTRIGSGAFRLHSQRTRRSTTLAEPKNIQWHAGDLSRDDRWKSLQIKGCTMWFTGLSASGKSTIASALELALVRRGVYSYRLDGDNIRHNLNNDLGFSAADRAENIRRIGEVARLFADSGCIALTGFISPYRRDRDLARQTHEKDGLAFIEVFVDTPIEVCEQRDPKGLYKKARAGQLKGFTGIDDPYEPPLKPELVLKTATNSVEQCVRACLELLRARGIAAE